MRNFFSNPEIRALALKLMTLALVTGILLMGFTYLLFTNLNKTMIDKNISIMGRMVHRHPELKDQIIPMFIKEPSDEELQMGINHAKTYGYDESLPFEINMAIADFYKVQIFSLALLFLLAFSAFSVVVFFFLRGFYARVENTALAAQKIVDGDFNVKLPQEQEGEFSKLGHHFNEMARGLQLSLESLKMERVFLKDTISDISHQLKTPLSSLKMFNELLLDGAMEDTDTLVKFLESSQNQLERMNWLIKNLLKMAKIEAGAVAFDTRKESAMDTVYEALEPLEFKGEAKNLRIEVKETSPGISFNHDKKWLAEAITNIVKNCIENTPEGGRMDIRITENPVMARIIIEDSGQGISPEELPRIFERFYKVRSNTEGEGVGIGLALAKSIIEGQGGMISVKSSLGEGTSFTITFPKIEGTVLPTTF